MSKELMDRCEPGCCEGDVSGCCGGNNSGCC